MIVSRININEPAIGDVVWIKPEGAKSRTAKIVTGINNGLYSLHLYGTVKRSEILKVLKSPLCKIGEKAHCEFKDMHGRIRRDVVTCSGYSYDEENERWLYEFNWHCPEEDYNILVDVLEGKVHKI